MIAHGVRRGGVDRGVCDTRSIEGSRRRWKARKEEEMEDVGSGKEGEKKEKKVEVKNSEMRVEENKAADGKVKR